MIRKYFSSLCFAFFIITFISNEISYCALIGPTTNPFQNGSDVGKTVSPRLFIGKINTNFTSKLHPNSRKVKPSTILDHTIPGDWDEVIAHTGFFYTFEDIGAGFISIIGLGTYPENNSSYSTDDWNREAFWIEIGDGVPMHLGSEFAGEYYYDDTETDTYYVYQNFNLLYRQQGKDYSGTEYNGEWVYLEFITDTNNQYLDHDLIFLDENDEEVGTGKLHVGDQIQAWTTFFVLDEPDVIWLTTMEEKFRTITQEANIFLKHLTPNKDFQNAFTENLIDFNNIDLQLVLLGIKVNANGSATYQFSTPKDLQLKWGLTPSTSVVDWFLSFF